MYSLYKMMQENNYDELQTNENYDESIQEIPTTQPVTNNTLNLHCHEPINVLVLPPTTGYNTFQN